MAENGSDESEGYRSHDHQRIAVGGENPGQDQIDEGQTYDQSLFHVGHGFVLFGGAAFERIGHAVVGSEVG